MRAKMRSKDHVPSPKNANRCGKDDSANYSNGFNTVDTGSRFSGGQMTTDKYSAFPSILVDRPAQGVLRLTLNRPDRLNALDADGHRELADIWRIIDRDKETLAVLLCANGRTFSAGGDFE